MCKAFIVSVLCLVSFLFLACNSTTTPAIYRSEPSKEVFVSYLLKGDSVYAQKSGLGVFEESLKYYDTAAQIAQQMEDSVLIAEALFARGRVYDAYNKIPQKTIEYFSRSAALMQRQNVDFKRVMYVKYLVAHAYDKVPDSAKCIQTLKQMYGEIEHKHDSIKKLLLFIPQMALAASEVGNYAIAERILDALTRDEWIKNDPNTYDYRDMYYLTRARIDIHRYQLKTSKNLLKFIEVYNNAKTGYDSLYYSEALFKLFRQSQNHKEALKYLIVNRSIAKP